MTLSIQGISDKDEARTFMAATLELLINVTYESDAYSVKLYNGYAHILQPLQMLFQNGTDELVDNLLWLFLNLITASEEIKEFVIYQTNVIDFI
jgi:hypothetical protein